MADLPGPSARPAPVVLVTGAASGMGRAAAERYAAGGWRVALVDRDRGGLAAAEQAIHAGGGSACGFGADVTLPVDIDAAVTAAVAHFGRLDVVIAAAGVWSEGPVELLDEAEYDRVMDVNVRGVVFTARAAIGPLRAGGGGAILVIASDAGIQANRGAALYCASKGAVVLFAKTLALDLAPDGIRVNAVCPGIIDTPMQDAVLAKVATARGISVDELVAARNATVPLGRGASADECAAVIWFLLSDESSYMTGQAVNVTGGLAMH